MYGFSLLTNVHTFIHLYNGQFWMTLKNVPFTHEETLCKCKVHALYLGRGLFVELMEWDFPLQIIDNPDPKVTSIVIGELTELEQKTYDDILHTGLGSGKTKPTITCILESLLTSYGDICFGTGNKVAIFVRVNMRMQSSLAYI